MTKDELKKKVGWAALEYIRPYSIIGIGTGSTISYFIDALSTVRNNIKGVVSSSELSSVKLKHIGISTILDLNDLNSLDIYVDSADEINGNMQMIKGGGAALTKEKIIAAVANTFICIVDISKKVDVLGRYPLPIEIIPMSRSFVEKEIKNLGGLPKPRKGIITDNGNSIIDVYNFNIFDAISLEEKINNIPGVVTVGLFARRCADIALISSNEGIQVLS